MATAQNGEPFTFSTTEIPIGSQFIWVAHEADIVLDTLFRKATLLHTDGGLLTYEEMNALLKNIVDAKRTIADARKKIENKFTESQQAHTQNP